MTFALPIPPRRRPVADRRRPSFVSRRAAARLAAGAAALAASPTAAQQAAPPATGGDVVVTGRGLAAAPGDRAFDVVTIPRERIEANASDRLESVLADVAGLQQFRRSDSRSANPTSQGITLRGLGGNASSRALLVLDGVPQTDPFGGWVALPAYATDRLGLVRVTRGGGSGVQGPGALAGTVELQSATPADLPPLAARASYGSRDSIDAQGSATLARAPGFLTLSGAYARGDGFAPTVREDRGPVDRAAPYEQASGAARAVVGLGGATELQANVAAFTDRRDRGTAFTANKSEGADASLRLVGQGRWRWAALGYLQTRAFASSFASITPRARRRPGRWTSTTPPPPGLAGGWRSSRRSVAGWRCGWAATCAGSMGGRRSCTPSSPAPPPGGGRRAGPTPMPACSPTAASRRGRSRWRSARASTGGASPTASSGNGRSPAARRWPTSASPIAPEPRRPGVPGSPGASPRR